jgi:ferredoxin-NADP reductase
MVHSQGADQGHVAGQHVDLRLTAADAYTAVRSYSIASAPNSERRIAITVERLSNGEVSPYLTQEFAIGDRLELRGPIGGWFVWRTQQTEPIQLIAGGSGIVPLVAMIQSRASAGSTALFRLLYSVREPAAVFYRGELRALSDHDHSVALPTRTPELLRRTGREYPAASTPLRSQMRPGPLSIPRLVMFAVLHRSWKLPLASLPARVIAPTRYGRSALVPLEIHNEFTSI